MFIFRLILKNALRHKLRTFLTILGICIAVTAFGFLRTIVTAWSAGVEMSSVTRMITRHKVSFIMPLPKSYREKIQTIADVDQVTYANWFGGLYKDPNDWKNFFPRMAVDPETYFDIYPEFVLSEKELADFRKERNACVVGTKIAKEHGFKIGDIVSMDGDIYPGKWDFVVRGIYKGKDETWDETQMLFQWDYLNERITQQQPTRQGNVGWYVLRVKDQNAMPAVAREVDELFSNSRAGTKTETEKEFQQSFVSMSSAIITSLEAISYIIIGIILLILANTIAMAARERTREYAVLKTLGFSSVHIVGLIAGESLLLACLGGALGLALTFPISAGFAKLFPTFFPIFNVEDITIILAVSVALLAGIIAATFPTSATLRTKIADGLRQIG